jgi:hypothetical protein fgonA2_06469
MIETLDISFIKLVILFLPGIIGMTIFLLLFVPKIKLDFKEKLLYSIILSIFSYLSNFEFIKELLDSKQILNKGVTKDFIICAIFKSVRIVFLILVLNKLKIIDKIFSFFDSNIIEEEKNLLDIVYKKDEFSKYLTKYVTIRCKDGNRYVGVLEMYTYKDDIIHLFMYDVDWYKPNKTKVYSSYKSIVLHFKIVDISLEYMEGKK